MSATEAELVRQAAELLMRRRPADVDQQVRATNAITRIFARLGKSRREAPGEQPGVLTQLEGTP